MLSLSGEKQVDTMSTFTFCWLWHTLAFWDSTVFPWLVGINCKTPGTIGFVVRIPAVVFWKIDFDHSFSQKKVYSPFDSSEVNVKEKTTFSNIILCTLIFGQIRRGTCLAVQDSAFGMGHHCMNCCVVSPGPISDRWCQKLFWWRRFPSTQIHVLLSCIQLGER